MNWADYSIIALLGFSCIVGFMRGLLREAISLVTWLLAATLAWRMGISLEPHLGGALTSPLIRPWAARGIIFVGILLVGTAAGAIISHFVRLSIFSGMDRMLGAFFGAVRGLVLLGVVAILGQTVKLDGESWYRQSTLLPYASRVADVLRVVTGTVREATATVPATSPALLSAPQK
jgi:membrane protein required for colicin V production